MPNANGRVNAACIGRGLVMYLGVRLNKIKNINMDFKIKHFNTLYKKPPSFTFIKPCPSKQSHKSNGHRPVRP
jgi:hypothetical protein